MSSVVLGPRAFGSQLPGGEGLGGEVWLEEAHHWGGALRGLTQLPVGSLPAARAYDVNAQLSAPVPGWPCAAMVGSLSRASQPQKTCNLQPS